MSEMKIGQEAYVVGVDAENKALRRHLLDMGLTKGVKVTIKKVAPMGDPIDIALRDYELCVSKNDLEHINVSESNNKLQ